MMPILSAEDIRLFEDYTNGTLSEEEDERIAHRLISEATFKQSYEQFLTLKNGVRFSHLNDVLQDLKEFDKNTQAEGDLLTKDSFTDEHPFLDQQNPHAMNQGIRYHHLKSTLQNLVQEEESLRRKQNRIRWLWPSLSVAFVTLIAAAWVFIYWPSQQNSITRFLTEEVSSNTVRGSQDLNPLAKAHNAYVAGKYRKSIRQFLATDDLSFNDRMTLGNAYLQTKKYDQALQLFQSMYEEDKNDERVWWYLGLTHYALKNASLARPFLLKIVEAKSPFYSKPAQDLLKELD